ncbi:MAG: cysteine--tRNA ligase [Patescibacteria group bacterium]|jgi:cysteinyl-tRNA synthetase
MDIKLYNTLHRTKEIFHPIHEGKVGIYCCGPTVYQRASIGNFRSYVFADLLRRTLIANGYEVKHIVNITDVGHLTDDASAGEDKMEKAATNAEKSAWDIAAEYTALFEADAAHLNILPPTKMPKATDHIGEQIKFIEDIEKAGYAYQISDGLYFDTGKLENYGELSPQKSEEKEEGARVAVNEEKRNPTDFALWKFSRQGEHRQMEWPSPWGVGFPGWHIECSAMSEKYLDLPFDIHTGGIDHIAVHHTNEIAQSLAARGVNPATYWMHNAFLLIDGGKMSKSLGNTYSLDDLKERGIEPLALRYFFLGAHYRVQENFTWEAIEAAQHALDHLRELAQNLDVPSKIHEPSFEKFTTFMNDDLNTPGALAFVWDFLREASIPSGEKAATLLEIDKFLGLNLDHPGAQPLAIPREIEDLVRARERVREKRDFEASDRLRNEIEEKGYTIKDSTTGPIVGQK